MFRKTALGIAAALVLLAPSAALAGKHGGHGHHGHHGHHHHGHHHHGHHHHRHVGYFYAGGSCYRYRWVETRYGLAKRLVNVCAY